MKNKTILLGHGSGGRLSHELISSIFVRHFGNPILNQQGDAAVFPTEKGTLAFTTDSYVVDPIFFPGADIGKLAVAGTVNDLSVSGAQPLYLSAGFIIEEGLEIALLEKVVESMAAEAKKAGIHIVTGDTKVVDRGKCDKIFINTAGVGLVKPGYEKLQSGVAVLPGDKIIINGAIADHGMAVMSARNQLNIQSSLQSDCASLNGLIDQLDQYRPHIHFMRDATRGGLGTVLAELCSGQTFGIQIDESTIPVHEGVRGMCELLGFDPLYVANEGKVVMVVEATAADQILEIMRNHKLGTEAAVIGEITPVHPGKCWLQTAIGGNRIVDMLAGEQLPRIC